MNKDSSYKQKGIVSIILLVIVALVILYYLNIPLQKILANPWASKIGYMLRDIIRVLWQDFILLFQFIKGIISAK